MYGDYNDYDGGKLDAVADYTSSLSGDYNSVCFVARAILIEYTSYMIGDYNAVSSSRLPETLNNPPV